MALGRGLLLPTLILGLLLGAVGGLLPLPEAFLQSAVAEGAATAGDGAAGALLGATPELGGVATAPSVVASVLQLRGLGLAIVAVLVLLSLLSWTIILVKVRELRAVYLAGQAFLRDLDESTPLVTLASKLYAPSPLPRLAARVLLLRQRVGGAATGAAAAGGEEEARRLLQRQVTEAQAGLESKLAMLATIASVAPSLGLLGTVYGIMETFLAIGASGSTSVLVVAPGIADALLTTLFGLAVAIPAVAGYNHCVRRLRRISVDLENGAAELRARAGASAVEGGGA
jgi:biopolymer transport protein TolQ